MRAASKSESSTAEPDKIRVLIADDHVTVLEGLAAIIGRQPDMVVVAQAADGQEALDLWIRHHPDVTLLDLRMPKLDGAGAIERIRRQDASARVIVLTTYETDTEILRAIKAGTKAYLLKDARREELLDCIRRVNRGETCIPASLIEKVAMRLEQRISNRPRAERAGAFGSGEKQQGDRRESLCQRNDGEIAPAQYLPQTKRS